MANTTNVTAPLVPAAGDLRQQFNDLVTSSYLWLESHWLQIVIAAGAGAVIFFALHGLRALGHKLCARDPNGTGWGTVIGRAVTKTNNFFIVMTAAKLVAGYANPPEEVATTITFLFTIAAVFQAAIWAREIILGAVEHRTNREGHPSEALGSAMGVIRLIVTFALFAIASVVVLDNLGVNVTGLVAGLGVGGIAIGLAAQGIFADLFAALAIIFDRPFRRGDVIAYDQSTGTVEEIGLKSTRIRGTNGEQRIISNKALLDKEITNNTRRERRRIIFTLGVAYETPVDVLEAIPDMIKAVTEANDATFVRAGFTTFNASTLDFTVEVDSPHQDFQHSFDTRHRVGLAILRKLNEEGISLPFPIQTAYTAAPDGTLIMPYEAERSAD